MSKQAEGFDAGHWRGRIGWWRVRYFGRKRFAFLQATEGLNYVDPEFGRNWRGAQSARLIRGAIHYLRPSINGAVQAEHLSRTVQNAGGLGPMDWYILEIEATDGVDAARVVRCCEEFASSPVLRHRSQIGKEHLALYTGHWFWDGVLGSPTPGQYTSLLKQWLAEYDVTAPRSLKGWHAPVAFWQYTDNGRVAGVNPPVDLDRVLGSFLDA